MKIGEHMKKVNLWSSINYELFGLCLVLVCSAQQYHFSSPAMGPHHICLTNSSSSFYLVPTFFFVPHCLFQSQSWYALKP